jgi:hypothetical protein
MTAGFVAFGVGVSLYAIELRSTLPGPAWTAALTTALATLGVAAFPLGSPTRDAVHGVFAAIGYVTLAALPLLAARSFARDGRQGWALASVAVAAVSAACLAATTAGPLHGLFQRAGLTVADAWIVATALSLRRVFARSVVAQPTDRANTLPRRAQCAVDTEHPPLAYWR